MHFFIAVAAGLVLGSAINENTPRSLPVELSESAHPCVFLSQEDVTAMRAKAATQEWARAIKERILNEAAELAAEPLDIPHEGGQWVHWYTCAQDGNTLRAESPTRHVCTVCGKVYSGPPYDQVYVTKRHGHWLGGIRTLGLAYAFDPVPAYAERIRAILLEYASFYESLPLHDVNNKPGKGARLLAQTLDESVLLCHVILGYDLVYDAPCFSPADHGAIRDGLLLPAVKTIRANPRAISNWQSWHNAAVGCIGFLLRDQGLADWAINGEFGFLYQMRESLMPSGMWFEECPTYHFYALNAHVSLMEAALRSGVNLYNLPVVKGMFDAPVRQLLPDLTFAPFQDSDRVSISGQRDFYEVAYARYHDPNYLRTIDERSGDWALMWGEETLPPIPEEAAPAVSSNAPGEGLAILRDSANKNVLFLDYGPGRSGHVQPGKLGIVLYAFGDLRFPDPGRIHYGNPMHKEWFRQTLAHNTVLVNQTSQKVTHGELEAFAAGPGYGLCRAACDSAYKDDPVTMDRCVAMADDTIIDVFQCSAKKDAIFDLPLHFAGSFVNPPNADPVPPLATGNGYQHLKEVRKCKEPLRAFEIDAGNGNTISVRLFGDEESFIAEGYGEQMKTLWPMVIRRASGKRVCFGAVYQLLEPGQTPVPVKAVLKKKPCIQAGDAKLTAGKQTQLKIAGKTCEIAPEP